MIFMTFASARCDSARCGISAHFTGRILSAIADMYVQLLTTSTEHLSVCFPKSSS